MDEAFEELEKGNKVEAFAIDINHYRIINIINNMLYWISNDAPLSTIKDRKFRLCFPEINADTVMTRDMEYYNDGPEWIQIDGFSSKQVKMLLFNDKIRYIGIPESEYIHLAPTTSCNNCKNEEEKNYIDYPVNEGKHGQTKINSTTLSYAVNYKRFMGYLFVEHDKDILMDTPLRFRSSGGNLFTNDNYGRYASEYCKAVRMRKQ